MSSRKRARAATTTPVTEPGPPALRKKITISGGEALPARLVAQWRQGVLCDATVTAEGRDFPVHRIIMTSASEYFSGAFTSGLAESDAAHVILPDVKANAMEAILSFMYTGECEVAEAELVELLEAAAYLQAIDLITATSNQLLERVAPHNCLEYWAFADAHGLGDLTSACKELALKKFEVVVATGEGGTSLPHARLLELLSDERLETKQEESVHQAIVSWARAQPTRPDDAALWPLFSTVRYPLVPKAFFEAQVATEPLLQGALGFKLISAAFVAGTYGPRVGRRRGFGLTFVFSSPFDTNGVLYHIATDGGKRAYSNPHEAGNVKVTVSKPFNPTYGHMWKPRHFVQHTHGAPVDNVTASEADSWMAVDLGEGRALIADHYCLRSDQNPSYTLRHWDLQGSNDDQVWTTIRRHVNDTSLSIASMSVAAWPIDQAGDAIAYRHFRIQQTGNNSRGSKYLTCAGIELYGRFV